MQKESRRLLAKVIACLLSLASGILSAVWISNKTNVNFAVDWAIILSVGSAVVLFQWLGHYELQCSLKESKIHKSWAIGIALFLVTLTTVQGGMGVFQKASADSYSIHQRRQSIMTELETSQQEYELFLSTKNLGDRRKTTQKMQELRNELKELDSKGYGNETASIRNLSASMGVSFGLVDNLQQGFVSLLIDILLMFALGFAFHVSMDDNLKKKKRKKTNVPLPANANMNVPPKVTISKKTDLKKANAANSNNKQIRMNALLDAIRRYPEATLGELAEMIGVASRETVRKYLIELDIYEPRPKGRKPSKRNDQND